MSQRKLKKLRQIIAKEDVVTVSADLGTGLRDRFRKIWKNSWLYLLGMTALIIAVYFNGMAGWFVSDDYASITANPKINDFGLMFAGGDSMSNSIYFIYKLFGFSSSVPHHLMSLVVFIAICWVAYVLLEVLFENKWLTRITMFIFAVHPIHVEAVTWISGRIYLIIAFYVLLAFLGFVCFVKYHKKKYLALSLISFVLGFLSDRPRPFSLILLIIIYFLTFGVKNTKIAWGKLILGIAILATVFLVLTWPNIMFRINVVNSGYNSSESIFYNPFFQYPTGLSKYFQLLWFPVDLTLYHTMYVFPNWLNWAILLTYLTMMVYFYFRNKNYFFALSFTLAAILPSIMPVKVSWLVAERYMFLGSFGFCLFMALVILDIGRYAKMAVPGIVAIILMLFFARTYLRNIDWQTNHNLWVNTCQVSPNSHNAWNNIGDDYDKLKQYENSIKGFTQSTVVKQNYADAYHNRANIFFKINRLDLARDSYETALSYSPGLYQTYYSLVNIDLIEKNIDAALVHANKAVQIQPNDAMSNYILGIVYAQAGDKTKAMDIFTNVLKNSPNYKPAADALQQLQQMP